VRRRERKMQRFKSSRSAQRFLNVRPQQLQLSTTSHLSVDPSDLQSRSSRPVARCGCRRMNHGSTSRALCTPPRYRDNAIPRPGTCHAAAALDARLRRIEGWLRPARTTRSGGEPLPT
jgi:hypothetical protein